MKTLCPICLGKGAIPNPKLIGIPMGYCGPNGERVPEISCPHCGGTGLIYLDQALLNNKTMGLIKVTISHIKEIMSLGKKSLPELRAMNPHWAYHGNELTKSQLIYQIVFLMDAPDDIPR